MRILVVDDEMNNLDEIKSMIERNGKVAEVVYFSNPLEALKAAKKDIFDAALLDIQMPEITGLELAENLSSAHPDIEIVFITAYNHYATEAFEVNAMDYILKPLSYERFEKAFNKLFTKEDIKISRVEIPMFKVLGDVRISYGKNDIKWNRVKNYELFAYLLLSKSKKAHKEVICEALWPELDGKRALANLQVTMCRLRKDLACFSKEQIIIEYVHDYYTMRIASVGFDLDEFAALAQSDDISRLNQAFDAYSGDLFYLEPWVWITEIREHYRKKYESVTLNLLRHYEASSEWQAIISLVEHYMSKGLPDERISQYYLDAVHNAFKEAKKDNEAVKTIAGWYSRELDMPVPKTVKRY